MSELHVRTLLKNCIGWHRSASVDALHLAKCGVDLSLESVFTNVWSKFMASHKLKYRKVVDIVKSSFSHC